MNKSCKRYQYLSCADMAEDPDSWWILECKYNMLLKIAKKTLDIECMLDAEDADMSSEEAYLTIVPIQDKLVLLPQNSLNVVVYDKSFGNTMVLPLKTGEKQGIYGAAGYALIENDLYVFSSYEECMPFVLNTETWNIRYLKSWKEQIKRYGTGEQWGINSVVKKDQKLLLGLYNTNIILKYDPEKDRYERMGIPDRGFKINKLYEEADSENLLVLSGNDKGIMQISFDDGMILKNRCWISEMGEKNVIAVLSDSEKIVLLPKSGTHIEIIDRKSGESWGMDISEEYLLDSCDLSNRFFYRGEIGKESICLFPFLSRGFIYIDKKSKQHYLTELKIDRRAILKKANTDIKKVYDERKMLLISFMDICNSRKASNEKKDFQIGTRIFNCIAKG